MPQELHTHFLYSLFSSYLAGNVAKFRIISLYGESLQVLDIITRERSAMQVEKSEASYPRPETKEAKAECQKKRNGKKKSVQHTDDADIHAPVVLQQLHIVIATLTHTLNNFNFFPLLPTSPPPPLSLVCTAWKHPRLWMDEARQCKSLKH